MQKIPQFVPCFPRLHFFLFFAIIRLLKRPPDGFLSLKFSGSSKSRGRWTAPVSPRGGIVCTTVRSKTAILPMARASGSRCSSPAAPTTVSTVFSPRRGTLTTVSPSHQKQSSSFLDLLAPSYIQGLTLLGGEPFRAGKSTGTGPLCPPGAGNLPAKDRVGLLRVHTGGAADRGQPSPLRGDGRAAVHAGRAGGRPLCGGLEGHLPAVPRVQQSTTHRHEKKHWHQARSSCCRIWTGNPVKHKEESSHHGNYGTEDRSTSDGKGPQPPRAGGGAGTAPPVHRKV